MKLTVNGQEQDSDAVTVGDLIARLGYNGNHFAVAVNLAHVPRSEYAQTSLKAGDAVEILMPMQGG